MAAHAHLVRALARGFYGDLPAGEGAGGGLGAVVLDALTRREWVKEDLLAGELGLHPKQVRKCLRFLAEEQLVTREFRRERGGQIEAPEGADQGAGGMNPKGFTHSYSCIDYARCVDVARFRFRKMQDRIRDELDDKGSIQEYACDGCGREYTSFDAAALMVDPDDFAFRCASCASGKLVDKRGDDTARKAQKAGLRVFRDRLVRQLQPLTGLLQSLEGSRPPDYGTLNEWYAKSLAAAKALKAAPPPPGEHGAVPGGLQVKLGGGMEPTPPPGGGGGTEVAAVGGAVALKKEMPAWLQSGGSDGARPVPTRSPAGPSGDKTMSVQEAYINEFLKRKRGDSPPPASAPGGPPEKKVKIEPLSDAAEVQVDDVAWEDAGAPSDGEGGGDVEWEDA